MLYQTCDRCGLSYPQTAGQHFCNPKPPHIINRQRVARDATAAANLIAGLLNEEFTSPDQDRAQLRTAHQMLFDVLERNGAAQAQEEETPLPAAELDQQPPKPARKRVQTLSSMMQALLTELEKPGHFIEYYPAWDTAYHAKVFDTGPDHPVGTSSHGRVIVTTFRALKKRGKLFLCFSEPEMSGNPWPREFWATERDKPLAHYQK
jgi:hypothetical protein